MNLPPLSQAFVLHFGEMGSRWGINRTVGQIYALLFIAEGALLEQTDSAEDRHAQARMRGMYQLMEQITEWFAEIRKLSPQTLSHLMALGGKVSLLIIFVGTVIVLPMIIGYTVFAYRVFSGKASALSYD